MVGNIYKYSITFLLCWALCVSTFAASQDENIRPYTQEHPLVYEDVFDLWPYSFLNENGEPDGYNVDLIRMMLKELDIPYIELILCLRN